MFQGNLLRFSGMVALFFFLFVCVVPNYAYGAKEEDTLLKARKLYQDGDYESAIQTLDDFINKLKAIVAQKKNVAEAFYLLAKVYYTVGEDSKVEENLRKTFETYPHFYKEEKDFDFKSRVEKIRAEVKSQLGVESDSGPSMDKPREDKKPVYEDNVYEQPTYKKKKKFPIILLVAGLVVVGALVFLLLGKKKDYNIVGTWALTDQWPSGNYTTNITFSGSKTSGTFVDSDGNTGTYSVAEKSVQFIYEKNADGLVFTKWEYTGNFTDENNMSGTFVVTLSGGYDHTGSWSATKSGGSSMKMTRLSGNRNMQVETR